MLKEEKAVSEVLGMVMILSIMILVIGTIMLVAVPMIDSGKDRARMDVAMNSFLSLQNDIEEVVRGPVWVEDPYQITNINQTGPSRETEFELMGGTLTVFSNSTNVTCMSTNCSTADITIMIPPSNITYSADQDAIVYENGAVIRKYEDGKPLMVSDPLISIYDNGSGGMVVSIHVVSLNGTNSSTAGDGKGWVETRMKSYNQTVEPPGYANSIKTNIMIYSTYPDAWKEFFNRKLNGAGLVSSPKGNRTGYNISNPSSGMPLEVQIYGKVDDDNSKDIFLSIYESRLDVNLR